MKPLPDAFLELATELPTPQTIPWPEAIASEMYYRYCHAPRDPKGGHKSIPAPSKQTLANALETSMDEDRLHYAEEYAKQVLALTNVEDAVYFREGVLRKETTALIKYQKQRDHSVHTLHNYLLGWHIFSHSSRFQTAFTKALNARKEPADSGAFVARRFTELWCYVSLLHDVGYIFEGIIESEKLDLTDDMLRSGADYALDYFADVFWKELQIRRADLRQAAENLLKNRLEPTEGRGGAGSIAYFLRNIGDLNALALKLNPVAELPSDAFSLWALHYKQFGSSTMAKRIKVMEKAFYHSMEYSIDNIPRHLDHGVCGGLLLLKFSTWWFRAAFESKRTTQKPSSVELEVINLVEATLSSHTYEASHWWTSVVWATAAVALHNVQQGKRHKDTEVQLQMGPLKLSEDPLAYLGILVDILQEWDRHSVRRITTISKGERRMNSRDISIGVTSKGLIHLKYYTRGGNVRAGQKKMEAELNNALSNWKGLVEISFH